MKITIITPVLNAERTIEQCLLSVSNQTYSNIEHIVIDGGSVDGTLSIINKYKKRLGYFESGYDGSTTIAFNKGLKLASGDWVGFLNADDWYEPLAIEQVIRAIQDAPNVELVYGSICLHNKFGQMKTTSPLASEFWQDEMVYQLPIPHIGTFIRKSLIDRVGLFNENYKCAADHDYFIRLMNKGFKNVAINSVLAHARIGGRAHGFKGLHEKWIIATAYQAPMLKKTKRFFKYTLLLLLKNMIVTKSQYQLVTYLLNKFNSRHGSL